MAGDVNRFGVCQKTFVAMALSYFAKELDTCREESRRLVLLSEFNKTFLTKSGKKVSAMETRLKEPIVQD